MKSRIKLLDTDMINKIAAGEVVERPLSVIKELVENSIDARASAITIEIKDGGISLIRVTDNGGGIPRDQLQTAFLQHATSKISDQDDLIHVMTLGFRGEALASVAAVSKVEMLSKSAGEIFGGKIEIHGSQIVDEREIGCADGTTVTVRDLFYNIPARLKFLKKPSAESATISEMINRLALSRPDITFRYISNGAAVMQTNGNGDLKTAIHYVYGKDIAKVLIPVDAEPFATWAVNGFAAKPEASRGNRGYQNIFLNGRYIKSELIQTAVEDAYKEALMLEKFHAGKFPVFVLNLTIEPQLVDVNVHPNKLEARFQNEDEIFKGTHEAVFEALRDKNFIPLVSFKTLKKDSLSKDKYNESAGNFKYKSITFNKDLPEEKSKEKSQAKLSHIEKSQTGKPGVDNFLQEESMLKESMIEDFMLDDFILEDSNIKNLMVNESSEQELTIVEKFPIENFLTQEISTDKLAQQKVDLFSEYRIVGQIFQTYWIIQQEELIYIIDQHAAHERILYEEIIDSLKRSDIVSQRILKPVKVNLSVKENYLWEENKKIFKNFGFEIEEGEERELFILATPVLLKNPVRADFFIDVLDKLEHIESAISDPYELILNAIATISCKAAVKAHDVLNEAEIRAMIKKLLTLQNSFHCPHGRPIIIEISQYEIEKKFNRV